MKDWMTVVVDPAGNAVAKDLRRLHEGARIAAARNAGFVPAEAGPEIPAAPARGPVRMFDVLAAYPVGDSAHEYKPAGYRGRKTLQCADVFDVMAAKAARHRKRFFLSNAQVTMARHYRDLVERHACAGMRGSSIEAVSQRGSGGSGGEFIDAVLADGQEIQRLRNRIGTGSALVVRRNRPSSRGSRSSITDRRLVDIVCLEDGTISNVLKSHGWANYSKLTKALQLALGKTLDRMMGPVRRDCVSVARFGNGCPHVWD